MGPGSAAPWPARATSTADLPTRRHHRRGAGLRRPHQTDEGGVFVFYGSSTGLDQNGHRPSGHPVNADWKAEGNQNVAPRFGVDVNSAGDVNDDGFDDVIIGADEFTNGQTDEGAAFLFLGSATGLDNGGRAGTGTPMNADWIGEAGPGRSGLRCVRGLRRRREQRRVSTM